MKGLLKGAAVALCIFVAQSTQAAAAQLTDIVSVGSPITSLEAIGTVDLGGDNITFTTGGGAPVAPGTLATATDFSAGSFASGTLGVSVVDPLSAVGFGTKILDGVLEDSAFTSSLIRLLYKVDVDTNGHFSGSGLALVELTPTTTNLFDPFPSTTTINPTVDAKATFRTVQVIPLPATALLLLSGLGGLVLMRRIHA